MKDLVRYRAMESLCRQSAVFHPQESWRLLAQAEMWHHKAEDEIAFRSLQCNDTSPTARAETARPFQAAALPASGMHQRGASPEPARR